MDENNIKILAIDDNPDNLITIRALINETFPDSIIYSALSGSSGIEVAARENPDVILLDIVMPDMDGFAVCKKLKEDHMLCDIPVVFVTALKGDKESRIRGLEVGGEAFLAKPIDESELIAQIRAMIKIKESNVSKRDENFRLASIIAERTRELEQTHKATLNLLEDLRKENDYRQQTENKLRESEAKLNRAELASKSGNWEFNLENRIISVSAGFEAIAGLKKSKLSFEEFMDFIIPENYEYVNNALTDIIQQGKAVSIEFKIKRADNDKIIDVHAIAHFDNEGGKVFGVVRDITEQKEVSKALIESESLHKAVMSATPDIIIIIKNDGSVEKVSPSGLLAFGYDESQLIGKNVREFVSKDDWPKLESTFTQLLQNNPTGPHEYRT